MFQESATSVRIRIYSAEVENILMRLNACGIILRCVHKESELSVTVCVGNKDYLYTLRILERLHVKYDLPDRLQSTFSLKKVKSRVVFLISLLILIFVALYLPGRILFVTVIGNESVPARLVAETAAKCGVHFGSLAADIRSEKVKNAILQEIPELQWIGVNTSGCVATIYVEEKKSTADAEAPGDAVSSVVASCDGIVESCTVTRGTLLCEVGEVVREGEVLISGYTDCGSYIRATRADGEVYGQTVRPINAVSPLSYSAKGGESKKEERYGIKIGKKLINFENSSGIYDGSCARIYEEQYVLLPGDFILPVSFMKETVICYDTENGTVEINDNEDLLKTSCRAYIDSQMIAGTISGDATSFTRTEGCLQLTGYYICSELISRQRTENVLQGEK